MTACVLSSACESKLLRSLADAGGPFGLLPGGIGANWRTLDHLGGDDGEFAIAYFHGETVHAARGRAATLFADSVVLGAVARAFEPLRCGAARYATAKVRALLEEGNNASFHAGEFPTRIGIRVLGPIDHGFVQSIYFAGPEGLALEVACGRDIDGDLWVDPDLQELCGISADELAALKSPSPYEQPAESLAQPPKDSSKPQMWFGEEGLPEAVMDAPDEAIWADMSDTTPPGAADA